MALLHIYLLNQLKHGVNKESVGLNRDDSLGVFHNIPKPEIEKKKKQIVKRFKECGLFKNIISGIQFYRKKDNKDLKHCL